MQNNGEATTTTCILNGKHIQFLFASGNCQSLCLYGTNGFCRERFLCHHYFVSYAITVLLSFTVFLSLVTANTRKSSLTVSSFSVYMLMVLLYSFLITLSVVVISDIHLTKVGHTEKWNLSRIVVWGLKKQKFKYHCSIV